MKYQNGHHI